MNTYPIGAELSKSDIENKSRNLPMSQEVEFISRNRNPILLATILAGLRADTKDTKAIFAVYSNRVLVSVFATNDACALFSDTTYTRIA